jgi:putative nucleotidyltransferase-like protein
LHPVPALDSDCLRHDWPLLLEACSPGLDAAKVIEKAQGVVESRGLITLAQQHGVVAHLYSALAKAGSEPLAAALLAAARSARKQQLLAAMSLTAELFRVQQVLVESRTEFLVTKGPVLACRAYGDLAARRYADLDFLVRHEDILSVARQLAAVGYISHTPLSAIQNQRIPGEYIFHRPGTPCILEMHTQRSFRYFPRPLPIEDFLQRRTTVAVDGRAVPALSAEDEFVLISVHGAKHFWERLMWISDVAAMAQKCPQMDWERVHHSAVQVGAERMVRLALLLANRVLRAEIPGEMEREVTADSTCARIVKKIETWLPYAGNEPPALVQRALFRLQMRGRLLAGARYLTRLSFSTTEEDWSGDAGGAATSLRESLGRPFRLAKKYGRGSKKPGQR